MPVTTRIISAASGSRENVRSMTRSPEAIHVYAVCWTSRASGGSAASCHTTIAETTKDAIMTRQARPPDTGFGSRRPIAALTRKPRKGNSGISGSTVSPLQRGERFRVQRLAMPEERDDDGQADRGFRGGDGHHEKGDDLPVHVAQVATEGDE